MCCRRQDFGHQDVGGNSVPSVQATKSGAALKAVPKQSQHLVAYMEAPRPARKQPAVDADEPAPAAGDQEEATEADAPSGSGGGDGGGFVLD